MKLAYYAPLKPPDHPVPSGDRTMARNLMAALEGAGADLTLASRLRSRDGAGDAKVQRRLMAEATAALPGLIATGRSEGWQAWVTYHSYYKAPDLLGPPVADALNIPYLQIEATRARKRLGGPWDLFAQSAEAACDAAQTIFYLTERDGEALHRDAPDGQELVHLKPFLARNGLPTPAATNGPMLAVGMMRAGDKMGSYEIIAKTLPLVTTPDWQLHIAGDGSARANVEALMAPFGNRVTFLGELGPEDLAAAYTNAALLFWPGVNEAFGLAYLEAQGAGLPVVAQDRPGVRDVLAPGHYPAVDAGPEALATALDRLLADPALRACEGTAARAYVEANHLISAASKTLREGLSAAGVAP